MNTEKINNSFTYIAQSDKPVFIMLMGLPLSGKSTIIQNAFIQYGDKNKKPIIHSSDELRKELFGDINDQNHNHQVFQTLHRNIKRDLRRGVSTIYDATNLIKKRRIAFLNELKSINCEKVCICVLTPYGVCKNRNYKRTERPIPNNVLGRMYRQWCPPSLSEGFDDIILAYEYDDLSEKSYTLKHFFEDGVNANCIDQENRHHTLTIGKHCLKAYEYINEHSNDRFLKLAALLHDCGKPFTKSIYNAKGEIDGDCHYYCHENCGAYDSMFYTDKLDISQDKRLDIANLIYYHMKPYTSWKDSEKSRRRDKGLLGNYLYECVMLLHEADEFAH